MSKLIGRARARLISAKSNYMASKRDERNSEFLIDSCCFDLQQSMEFFLKGIIELQGNQYAKNHDLLAQLNQITPNSKLDHVLERIRNDAMIFNSWEADSQYKDSFVATVFHIEAAIAICEELERITDGMLFRDAPEKMNLF